MKPVIVLDDLGGGVSVISIPARDCLAQSINSLLHIGCGPVRVMVSRKRAELFQLEPMNNRRAIGNAAVLSREYFAADLISVEARSGVHSGISAADRATTVAVLGSKTPNPRDIISPGHVFPRLAAVGGLLQRADAFQGALEYWSQFAEADDDIPAACVEIFNDAGLPASNEEVSLLAAARNIQIQSLTELVRTKLTSAPLISRISESTLPLEKHGLFNAVLFKDHVTNREHLALVRGSPNPSTITTVRIHRRNLLNDILTDQSDSRIQQGLTKISAAPAGVFIYLDGAPITGKFEPMRDYAIGAQILVNLGVQRARIITDSTEALTGTTIFGVTIDSQEPLSLSTTLDSYQSRR